MEHVLELLKWSHEKAGTEEGDDVSEGVKNGKYIQAAVQEESKGAEQG